MEKNKISKTSFSRKMTLLWDAFCMASIVGIWPRYIEPRLICTSRISLSIKNLDQSLAGTKIVQISDLHINASLSNAYLAKLAKSINNLNPDIIVITGDLICYSKLNEEGPRLEHFLNLLKAKHGYFVIFGNHDYAKYVTVAPNGDYDVDDKSKMPLSKAINRLLRKTTLTKHVSDAAKAIPYNAELINLLARTPFKILHNETVQMVIKGSTLNITGLGEYTLSRTDPSSAYENFLKNHPGITLLHNPDGIPLIKGYPADVVLCGHTHGGQVNLPWLWEKLTLMENLAFKRGLLHIDDKWIYINRGISGTLPFRWFAPPEILFLTLESPI